MIGVSFWIFGYYWGIGLGLAGSVAYYFATGAYSALISLFKIHYFNKNTYSTFLPLKGYVNASITNF